MTLPGTNLAARIFTLRRHSGERRNGVCANHRPRLILNSGVRLLAGKMVRSGGAAIPSEAIDPGRSCPQKYSGRRTEPRVLSAAQLFETPACSPRRANHLSIALFLDGQGTLHHSGLAGWEKIYNTVRPHQSLGYLTRISFCSSFHLHERNESVTHLLDEYRLLPSFQFRQRWSLAPSSKLKNAP